MALAKLKEKGQITLPADIRRKISANKGDLFECEIVDGKVVMTLQKLVPADGAPLDKQEKKKGVDISKYIGIAKGTYGSVEEIDEYIRNERDTWD